MKRCPMCSLWLKESDYLSSICVYCDATRASCDVDLLNELR